MLCCVLCDVFYDGEHYAGRLEAIRFFFVKVEEQPHTEPRRDVSRDVVANAALDRFMVETHTQCEMCILSVYICILCKVCIDFHSKMACEMNHILHRRDYI